MATRKRELIAPRGDKRFVRRDEQGRITESADVGRSLSQDRRRAAKTIAKPGQGDKGDRKTTSNQSAEKTMKKTATRKAAGKSTTGAASKKSAVSKKSAASKKSASRKSAPAKRAGTSSRSTRAPTSSRSAEAGSTRASSARASSRAPGSNERAESASRRASGDGARAPNAIALLKADHATVRELLGRLEETTSRGAKTREELLARLRREIEVHTTIEEEIFYPAFKEAGERQDDDKLYYEALEEHRAAGDLVLPDLLATDPSSECFGGRAKVLKELIEHHAREEEREMFPRARELFSAIELQALGERMLERKQALMAQPAPAKSIAGRMLSAVVEAITPEAPTAADGEAPAKGRDGRRSAPSNGSASRSSR